MLHKVFTVFDSKVGSYCPPFYFKSRGEALRSFTDTVTGKDSLISQHPEDFTLFELADYDDSTGKFDLYSTPVSVAVAIELLPKSI